MRRLLMLLSGSILMFGLVAVGPAEARSPERGAQVMVLNQDPETQQFGLFGCPEISWFGTIELDETTYGMALYPLPGRITGDGTILHYEEAWKVWTDPFTLGFDPGQDRFLIDDCDPGEVVLAGVDTGTASFRTGKFRSNGTVDDAVEPFAAWLGRSVHQDGVIGPIDYDGVPVVGFHGDLRLN